MTSIYEECLQRGSTAEALEIYQQARQLFLVQKNMPQLLGSWAHLWVEAGDAPDEVQADCDEYWIVPPAPSSGTTADFDIEPEDVNKLDEAIKLGISELDKELDRIEEWSLTRSRAMDVDKLRHQWKRRVVSALERELTEPESAAFETGFERLEASLLAVKETNRVKIEQIVRQALSDFLSDFEKATDASSPLQTSLDTYNLESWLQQFLHKGSSRFTTERILKKRLWGWIANYEA